MGEPALNNCLYCLGVVKRQSGVLEKIRNQWLCGQLAVLCGIRFFACLSGRSRSPRFVRFALYSARCLVQCIPDLHITVFSCFYSRLPSLDGSPIYHPVS